jgi:hypothetical protein
VRCHAGSSCVAPEAILHSLLGLAFRSPLGAWDDCEPQELLVPQTLTVDPLGMHPCIHPAGTGVGGGAHRGACCPGLAELVD